MKKALILSYSQTGQTLSAATELIFGLRDFGSCESMSLMVEEVFPFPWGFSNFFRAFPRCVLGQAPRLAKLDVNFSQYDLIILAGPVWFLSPSLPLQSFLNSPEAQGLKGKNVIVLLSCRNLWYSAARIMKEKLVKLQAHYLGHISICEISPLWASFVTTPRWMLTGKKEAFAFFPAAGIREIDFKNMTTIGKHLSLKLNSASPELKPFTITNLNRLSLLLMEKIGRRFFEAWAGLINAIAPQTGIAQDLLLVMFRVNLVLLILCLVPTTKLVEVFWTRLNPLLSLRNGA
jgi:hypothetical protein